MTHYRTLGVAEDATADEIKAAFRRAAAKAHPDRDGGDAQRMADINAAYGVIGDPTKRKRYDASGCKDGPTKQEMADQILRQLFDRGVEASDDVLGFARDQLEGFREKAAEAKRNGLQKLERLRKNAGKVKRKGDGPNLVELIIAKKISKLEIEQLEIAEAEEVHALVAAGLDNYEGPPPPKTLQEQQRDALLAMAQQSTMFQNFTRGYP